MNRRILRPFEVDPRSLPVPLFRVIYWEDAGNGDPTIQDEWWVSCPDVGEALQWMHENRQPQEKYYIEVVTVSYVPIDWWRIALVGTGSPRTWYFGSGGWYCCLVDLSGSSRCRRSPGWCSSARTCA